MKNSLLIYTLFFFTCINHEKKNDSKYSHSEVQEVSGLSNKINREMKNDTFCLNENNISQCCIIFSKPLSDSLRIQFAKDGQVNENYLSLGRSSQALKINKKDSSLEGSIFFLSFRDAIQKLVFEKVYKNTLYLRLNLVKEGKEDDFWVHQIFFSYQGYHKNIKNVVLNF